MADIRNIKEPYSTAIKATGRMTLLDKDEFRLSEAFDIDQDFARKELNAPQPGAFDSRRNNRTNIKSILKDFGNMEKHFAEKKSTEMQQHGNINIGPLVNSMVSMEKTLNRPLNQYRKECIALLNPKPKNYAHLPPSDHPRNVIDKLHYRSKKSSFANCDKSMLGTSSARQNFDIKKILKSINDVLKAEKDNGNDQGREQFVLDQNQPAVAKDKSSSSDTLQSTKLKNEPLSPLACDVLCGRGNICHPGNCLFRDLINLHRFLLRFRQHSVPRGQKSDTHKNKANNTDGKESKLLEKTNKSDVIIATKSIVNAIRSEHVYIEGGKNCKSIGKFLRKDTKSGSWYDIGDQQAEGKIKQALRERVGSARVYYYGKSNDSVSATGNEDLELGEEEHVDHNIEVSDEFISSVSEEYNQDRKRQVFPLGSAVLKSTSKCEMNTNEENTLPTIGNNDVILFDVETENNTDGLNLFFRELICLAQDQHDRANPFNKARVALSIVESIRNSDATITFSYDVCSGKLTRKEQDGNQAKGFSDKSHHKGRFLGIDRHSGKLYDVGDLHAAEWTIKQLWRNYHSFEPYSYCKELKYDQQKANAMVTVSKSNSNLASSFQKPDGSKPPANICTEGTSAIKEKASYVTEHKVENFENEIITEIRNTDVLFGRGAQTNHYTGNIRFRDLVNQHRPDYAKAIKIKKLAVAHHIVDAIRKSDPPGRFLKRDEETGFWYDVGDKQAAHKASKALREKSIQERLEARTKIVAEHEEKNSDDVYSRSGQVSLESDLMRQDNGQNVHPMKTSPKTHADGEVSGPTKRTHQNNDATCTSRERSPKRPRRHEDTFVEVGTNAALRTLIDMASSRPISAVDPMLQAVNREMSFSVAPSFVPNVMPSTSLVQSFYLLANGVFHNRSHHPNAQLAGNLPSIINRSDFQQVNHPSKFSLSMTLAEMERRQLLDTTLRNSLELAKLKLIQQNSVEMASRQLAEELHRRAVAEAFLDRQRQILQEMGISNVNKIDCKEANKEEKHQDDSQEFNKKSSTSEPQEENIEITEYDILCGRGGMTNNHKGNKRFRELISRHRPDYASAAKAQKAKVACLVLKEIRQGNPATRFLKKDEVSGTWYNIGDKKAVEKVIQALREKEK